ncbi:MAG: twin-arginine translocation signal domain-containing protein, partial [Chloroflexi bacterium]|nr:twin-arginine translocation signal domain-containing protein [Chloroflexota bacterium]
MAKHFSRRQFLKLGALVAGAVATVGAARDKAFDELVQTVTETAAQFPMFRANAHTTGELVGADGSPIHPTHASASLTTGTDGAPMQHAPATAGATGKHRWVMVID